MVLRNNNEPPISVLRAQGFSSFFSVSNPLHHDAWKMTPIRPEPREDTNIPMGLGEDGSPGALDGGPTMSPVDF